METLDQFEKRLLPRAGLVREGERLAEKSAGLEAVSKSSAYTEETQVQGPWVWKIPW